MPITRRADYAIRLVYELAQLPVGATLSTRDLCEAAEIPENFGRSLIPYLVEAGMVTTDGYRDHLLMLSRPASQIRMSDVVRACEPTFSLSECVNDPGSCARTQHCGVHRMWADLDKMVWAELESRTLADVVAEGTRSCGLDLTRYSAIHSTSERV